MADNDILQQITAIRRKKWRKRKDAGDPIADVLLFEGPWSIEALGPSILDVARLKRIENFALDGGELRNFWHDHELNWHDDRDAVFPRFLSSLVDQEGQKWSEIFPAAQLVWTRVNFLIEENMIIDSNESLTSTKIANFLFHSESGLGQPLRVANRMVRDAVETAWLAAFAEGRILVFQRGANRWRFVPPRRWTNSPPFRGETLEGMQATVREEARREKDIEIESGHEMFDQMSLAVARIFHKPHDEILSILNKSDLKIDHTLKIPSHANANGISDDIERRYLFAIDIPSKIRGHAGKINKANVDRRNRNEIEKEVAAWFERQVHEGRTWINKQAALMDIRAELCGRSGEPNIWGRASSRIWEYHAKPEWREAGRKPRDEEP